MVGSGERHWGIGSPQPGSVYTGIPHIGVFRLKGQSKRDSGSIVRSCKASQTPVYPIRDAILAVKPCYLSVFVVFGPPPMG